MKFFKGLSCSSKKSTSPSYTQVCSPVALKSSEDLDIKLQNLCGTILMLCYTGIFLIQTPERVKSEMYATLAWKTFNFTLVVFTCALYYKAVKKQRAWQYEVMMTTFHFTTFFSCFDFEGRRLNASDFTTASIMSFNFFCLTGS